MFVCFIFFFCFYIVASNQSFPSCVKNPKTTQKVWSTLLSFVSKYVLSCTIVQMALCIYEHSLLPMHSYQCGRNLEVYVTVVNGFVNLETCIDLCLYIVSLFILLFLLNELIKCKSPNKKRYWAAKACHTY